MNQQTYALYTTKMLNIKIDVASIIFTQHSWPIMSFIFDHTHACSKLHYTHDTWHVLHTNYFTRCAASWIFDFIKKFITSITIMISDLLIIKLWSNFLDHTRAISHKSFDRLHQILIEYFYTNFFMMRHKIGPTNVLHTHRNHARLKLDFMIRIFPHVLPRCRSTRQTHWLIQDFKN